MRCRLAQALALALSVVSLGAAQGPTNSGSGKVPTNHAKRAGPAAAQKPLHRRPYQVGTASWYGSDFYGKPTASGEPYDMYDMTAAHPTLPLGTYVQVTNLHNGRAVVVRINDRGPVVEGRIIDVSYNAARALNFKSKGLQRVRLDIVQQPQTVAMLRPLAN
ncbi:MAG TPA: septal ring lytic transglycosylase RlpA family protein [Terriglobales bacterium]|nr:septal ring lytic transglycosylase RlpA family protein [Terriglobales bacterium]